MALHLLLQQPKMAALSILKKASSTNFLSSVPFTVKDMTSSTG